MPEPTATSSEYPQFDALCAELGDYEPLPKTERRVVYAPNADPGVDDAIDAIDEEILARLVSP